MTKAAIAKAFVPILWPDGTRRSKQYVSPFTAGVWANITPPVSDIASTYGTDFVAIDPSIRGTIYVCADQRGMWKSSNFGLTWAQIGSLDSPVRVAVNPSNSNHLVATQGVRGSTLGFWVSTNGGTTWSIPAGFTAITAVATNDVTTMVINPADFNHILLGSHSNWVGDVPAGILETKDGGNSWTTHAAQPTWPSGSLGIGFLYDIATGQGNANTWLVTTDGDGFWRTTNAGTSWTKVSTHNCLHGAGDFHYTASGMIVCGAQPYPVYSTDNGVTWAQFTTGLTSAGYYSVIGDGTNLHTQVSNTGDNGLGSPQPYKVTSQSSPGTWVSYQSGVQTFSDGPFNMVFDSVSDLIYSANWRAGVWALKPIR